MRTRLLCALALCLAPVALSAQEYKVIAHPDAGVTELPTAVVANVFLRKERKLPGGVEANPVDLPASSSLREAFSKGVLGRPTSAVVTYWQQQVFSGRDTPPPSKPNDDAVVAFVKATPGAIGYVSSGANAEGVKVVRVK
jgi:ABC-type phosphate transport system substrate-binding protein